MIQGPITRRGKRFLAFTRNLIFYLLINSLDFSFFQNCPERHWGPPSLLFHGYRGSFLGAKWPGHKVDHQLHLMAKLRMNGTITPFPLYAFMAWSGKILPFLVAANTGSFTPQLSSWHIANHTTGMLLFFPLQSALVLIIQVTLDTEFIS